MVSKARLDLPDPDTPVTTVIALCGISKLIFLRLCTRAPVTVMEADSSLCTKALLSSAALAARVSAALAVRAVAFGITVCPQALLSFAALAARVSAALAARAVALGIAVLGLSVTKRACTEGSGRNG